jgi:hypothetical protein
MTVTDTKLLLDPWFFKTRKVFKFATNKQYRQQVVKFYQRRFRNWWYWEPKPYFIVACQAMAISSFAMWLMDRRAVRILLRVPTNDKNSLLHDEVFLSENNKSAQRADHLQKLMRDSNYHTHLGTRTTDNKPDA